MQITEFGLQQLEQYENYLETGKRRRGFYESLDSFKSYIRKELAIAKLDVKVSKDDPYPLDSTGLQMMREDICKGFIIVHDSSILNLVRPDWWDANDNNYFRAWHDMNHAKHSVLFDCDSELKLFEVNRYQINADRNYSNAVHVFMGETFMQTLYYMKHGNFPEIQAPVWMPDYSITQLVKP